MANTVIYILIRALELDIKGPGALIWDRYSEVLCFHYKIKQIAIKQERQHRETIAFE